MLKAHGVKFQTQSDIIRLPQDSKDDDRPRLTPDILVQGNLLINGREVKWIDAKNFFGGTSRLMTKKAAQQMSKVGRGQYGFLYIHSRKRFVNID